MDVTDNASGDQLPAPYSLTVQLSSDEAASVVGVGALRVKQLSKASEGAWAGTGRQREKKGETR